jgi:hypothetical protein
MSNMSYCRFQNTLKDLSDCHNALWEGEELSEEEENAKKRLIKLCKEIIEEFGEED